MENTQWVKETIQQHFKTLEINQITKLGEGWMSRAYLVNEAIVFRFPKKKEGARDTEKEIRALLELNDHLSLAIPAFTYISFQKNGFPFVGYPVLPGEPLDEQQFHALPDRIKEKLAHQLAHFMDEMQAVDLKRAKRWQVPKKKFKPYYAEAFNRVQAEIYPKLSDAMKEYISDQYDRYLNQPQHFKYQPKLLHADLSCEHLLFDQNKGELTGIIDFGDLQIGDPDFEYIYLLEECGETSTIDVMKKRGEKDIPTKLKKVHRLLIVESVRLLVEASDMGEEDFVADTIAFIQAEMEKE